MSKKHKTQKPKSSQPVVRSKVPADKTASFTRRRVLLVLGAVAAVGIGGVVYINSAPTMADEVVVYKDPSCGCCGRWVSHMRRNGFAVTVNNVEDMDPIKQKAKIPEAMESCHTAYVGGYSIEGHVPASDIKKILSERPAINGLAVPGMPSSAPGMDSPEAKPYTVFAFNAKGATNAFAYH
jgi:hypothetical protein